MVDLPITCRGMAYPWQCDVNGHLNVMWHTNMFDQASFVLVSSLGVDQAYREKHQATVVTVQCDIAYKREVHAGHILAVRTRVAEVRDKIIRMAHDHGAKVLIDGCQAVPHMQIDVQALDADFYVFSGHKLYGPSGIGILYGKADLLNAMRPYHGGGEMINTVSFEESTFAELPFKFEAGTPHIAGAIALGAAVDFVSGIGLENIAAHEAGILAYATERLREVNSVRLIGTAPEKAAILSFNLDDIHPHDVGTILDRQGIAVRTGHHCAQPVMERYDVSATVRASFGLYNTRDEVDALVASLRRVQEIFGA